MLGFEVGANMQLPYKARYGDAKFNRGWDQLMYDSLMFLSATHKLMFPHTSPRQEEDYSSIAGSRVEHAHGVRTVVPRQTDVDASTGLYNFWFAGIVHLSD